MPDNTIGKIILEAGSRAQAQTGGGAPGLAGLIGGESGAEGAATKIQKETRNWQSNMLKGMLSQPRWWTRMFKTMGIQVGLSGILKQSQIFTSTIGSLFQILGAFIDVILAPFVPLFIPALRWLARKLPDVAKWAEGFADKVKIWGTKIGDFLGDPWGNMKTKLGEWWDSIKETVKGWVLEIGYAIGDLIDAANIFGGAPKALQRPKPQQAASEESDWGDRAKAAADKAWDIASKGYLATAASRGIGNTLALGGRSMLPTRGVSSPVGWGIDVMQRAAAFPNKAANAAIKTAIKTPLQLGGSVLDLAGGSHFNVPNWAKLGGAGGTDLAQAGGGWGAKGAPDVAEQTGRFGNIFSKAKGFTNNPLTRNLTKAITGPVLKAFDVFEGIYDTKNIIQAGMSGEKEWFEGTNLSGWASGWKDTITNPHKLSSWTRGQEGHLFPGAVFDATARGAGTVSAVVMGPALGGVVSAATERASGTGYGQDRYGSSDFIDVIGASIKDGFLKGVSHIPGIS